MRKLNLFYRIGLLLISCTAYAGGETGNGGDFVRGSFLKLGEKVIAYLRDTDDGRKLVLNHRLDLQVLNQTLVTDKIKVIDGPLVDNRGSVVDATGEPGRIILQKNEWKEHFDRHHDVAYLVLHEIFRETGKYDDSDFKISKAINPFPACVDCRPSLPDSVLSLREKFRNARFPRMADLKLGRSWLCVNYIADKGGFSFSRANEFLFKEDAHVPFFIKNHGKSPGWSNEGLLTRDYDPIREDFGELYSTGTENQYVRITDKGDLVVERTASSSGNEDRPLYSLARCDHKVIAYELCKTNW